MAGGLRFNEGKQRFDLLPPSWPRALVEVLTKGAEKYEDRNWERGMNWSTCYASMMRHIQAWWEGNDIDPESGLPHMAHAAWNALALVEYMTTHPELDDRPGQTRAESDIPDRIFPEGLEDMAGTELVG